MKYKIGIIDSEIQNSFIKYFFDKNIEICLFEDIKSIKDVDIIALYNFDESQDLSSIKNIKILNLHSSLLPSFKGKYPIKQTFISGVKVGGITIHEVEQTNFYSKILAQYPVLIGNSTHYDEYFEELKKVSEKIYPIVVDSVLNDRIFDFADLMQSKCSGNGCGGNCSNCH